MQLFVPWDPSIEKAFSDFSEKAYAAEARVGSLHQIDKELYVSALREELVAFYENVEKGYEILLNTVLDLNEAGKTLAGIKPTNKRSIKAIKHLFPSKEALEKLSKPEALGSVYEEGKPLFVALEISPKAMEIMYEASSYLLDENRDEEASMSFRTLLALAPHIADFWTAYGVTLIRLKRHEEAITSLKRALFLDSCSVHALLLLCRVLVEMGRQSEAQARLAAILDDAAHRGDKDLYELLESARFELVKFAAQSAVR